MDKEMAEMYPEPHKKSDTRFVDKLVKVYTTAGTARYLLIHIEVQGQYDKEFTKRMFTYFYRIYDRFLGHVLFDKPEMNRIFRKALDCISGKKNTMGIIEQVAEIRAEEALEKGREEGREEGRTEEKTEVIKRLLSDKEFSIARIASIAGVSVAFVEKVKKSAK